LTLYIRQYSSSTSSTRWKNRQGRDSFAREARVQGLKSRAAFKLLEIDARYKIFKKGQTVVDLGYAPGSWSQVAVERTKPNGRIVGIDIIPAQPPKGVSTIQGNFLSPEVQTEVKRFLADPERGRAKPQVFSNSEDGKLDLPAKSYIDDLERLGVEESEEDEGIVVVTKGKKVHENDPEKMVDVVLSDMMMNTSGINFKDHNDSMNLCHAALNFARDSLRIGGHFVCKYYQGDMEKQFEDMLKSMFKSVHRDKPKSSRSESKEAYFVALRRKKDRKVKIAESQVLDGEVLDKVP
jgi:21S rRNA (uridine2791-2'-O)-methyltransferase